MERDAETADTGFSTAAWRRVILAILVVCSMALPVVAMAQDDEGEWEVYLRFLGKVVAMEKRPENIPTLAIGFDPRYQMKVEVLEIHQGPVPVEVGEPLAFWIHSPSLLFGKLGTVELEGFLEGPFEFTVLRKRWKYSRLLFDLQLEKPAEVAEPGSG